MYIVHTLSDLENNGMESEVRVFAKQVNAIKFAKIEKDDLIKEVFKKQKPEVDEQESLDNEVVYSCVVQGYEDYWRVTVEKMSAQDGESLSQKESVIHDLQAKCDFCGHISETELNMVDDKYYLCTSCEKEHNDIRNYCENEQIAEAVEAQLKSEKLMYALLQFENYAREIKQICLETDEETHTNLCDDYR
ncbi:hypothetical protein [Bacillus halotolerans]|uniref:hypothetical protein n=1 Tax=Bacillus halotolerans TaxID=260554 RepID=UPI00404AFC53